MNDSFVTTVSAESILMEDASQSIKGGARSLSDLFKEGLSDSSLDFFAYSSSDDLRNGRRALPPGNKDLLRNHERRGRGKRASKGAVGSISDLLDSSDSCDFDEFQLTSSTFPFKESPALRKSRREKVTQSRGIIQPPSEKVWVNSEERDVSTSSKKGLGSYLLAKSKSEARNTAVKEKVKANTDLTSRSYLVKMAVDDKVTNGRKDAPPRGARRLPSMDNVFMDSWQSKSSDSYDSNHKTPLYPYLQTDNRKPAKGCDASVVSEISAITWSSGVSSLSVSSEDNSIVPEPCIRHSLDEALQGSFNFIEDAVPKRPARRQTPSPPRRRVNPV